LTFAEHKVEHQVSGWGQGLTVPRLQEFGLWSSCPANLKSLVCGWKMWQHLSGTWGWSKLWSWALPRDLECRSRSIYTTMRLWDVHSLGKPWQGRKSIPKLVQQPPTQEDFKSQNKNQHFRKSFNISGNQHVFEWMYPVLYSRR